MKKVIAGICFSLFATVVYANCSTHTINSGGKFVTCTTCCYGGNCTTNCY
jgi:heme O synthase-like polyprenyltransferase